MGLDMYLNARRHLWAIDDNSEDQKKIRAIRKIFPELDADSTPSTVVVEVAYWRKANAIHHWFVQNCQDGVDECQATYVSKDQLRVLHDAVKQVLSDHSLAHKVLPSKDGFFFGQTDYNDWYFRQLEYTNKRFNVLLDEAAMPGWSYEYRASW